MTSPAESCFVDVEEDKNVGTHNNTSYTIGIGSMAETPYRQLQYVAKMCGVPCNLKRDSLKRIIEAKANGNLEEVDLILKQVKEGRLLRKKQRAKALEKSKTYVKVEVVEENNNGMRFKDIKDSSPKMRNVKEILRKIVKMGSARNVTIQQKSTHTHYRALVTPSTWRINTYAGVAPTSTITSQQDSPTINHNPCSWFATLSKLPGRNQTYPRSNYGNINHMSNTVTAPLPASANQWGSPQFNCRNGHNYIPTPAASVRETMIQQYCRNTVNYEPSKRFVDIASMTEGLMCHSSNLVTTAYQPIFQDQLEHSNQLYNRNQMYNSIQNCNNNQLHTYNPQMGEIACCQAKPADNQNQPSQQCESPYYGAFHQGIQRTSTPCVANGYVGGTQNSNVDKFMTNAETSTAELQSAYTIYDGVPNNNNNVPYQKQLPMYEAIHEISPTVIDLTDMPFGANTVDTDLDLLAKTAMTKAQEVDETKNQQNNNNLLMISKSNNNLPVGKDEWAASDSKLLGDQISWKHMFEQMSYNLSPGVTNQKVVLYCKYGCQTPLFSTQEQMKHERCCLGQPAPCPISPCIFVSQLRSFTTHMLNVHNNHVRSSANGTFMVDLTDRKCFEEARSSILNAGPKKLCFLQLVNGRLFLINIIANFDSMQVIVFVQYVNDHFNWSSYVALEVVREDGVPYQWTSEVPPFTYNPLQIITKRKCLIFNMNGTDFSSNLFVLHTKIRNCIKSV